MMGAERRSMVMNESEKKLTAYHEAGHAIVGLTVPDHDPVYKVSIIPGPGPPESPCSCPNEDRYSYSKRRIEQPDRELVRGRDRRKNWCLDPMRLPRAPRTISSGPRISPGTWLPSGACRTGWAR